jgi:DNA invertase Pin-like site-specific DNA recombinase
VTTRSRREATPPTAYSYVRFSHPSQAEGDSLRRQTERAAAYCKRRGWTLSEQNYRDLGVSAFRGKNALVGNLGEFLKAVESGAVRPDAALIVESVDRISRQGIDEGYDLVKRILKAGVTLVTLSPEREFDVSATKSLTKGALELQLILERAAEESERKSDRVGAAWSEKVSRARDGGEVLTHNLPAWVEERGGKLRLIPDRAKVVRQIFRLAAEGYGERLTAKWLIEHGVPCFTRGGRWSAAYVGALLRDRRALGEFQPYKRSEHHGGKAPDGRPAPQRVRDGDPMPNYFPAAVTEQEWLKARGGTAQRVKRPGRVGEYVNVFAGLITNALDGDSYFADLRPPSKGRGGYRRVLANGSWCAGRAGLTSFPLPTFERAIFSALREVDPREVLPRDEAPDEARGLEEEIAGVTAELSAAADFMAANGFSATIGKRITNLEDRKRDLEARLLGVRAKAAAPTAAAWKEYPDLLAAVDKSPDPRAARLRLRAVLRRIIDGIWLIVVPRGQDRLAEAQIWFTGGEKYRSYFILHRAARGNGKTRTTPGRWAFRSMTHPEDARAGLPFNTEDLRDSDEAEWVRGFLEEYPTDMIDRLLAQGEVIE